MKQTFFLITITFFLFVFRNTVLLIKNTVKSQNDWPKKSLCVAVRLKSQKMIGWKKNEYMNDSKIQSHLFIYFVYKILFFKLIFIINEGIYVTVKTIY